MHVEDSYLALSDKEAENFISLIHTHSGIKLDQSKKALISSRLLKRLRILGIDSLKNYFDYLQTPEGQNQELGEMIDEITTNKTSFFREKHHFDYLEQTYLPEILGRHSFPWQLELTIWSAGCSTGEEPFTIAMVMTEFIEKAKGGNFSIVGTDISTQALLKAWQAVYDSQLIGPIPLAYQEKYLMRGKGKQQGNYRVIPELREHITFQYLNFIEPYWDIPQHIDIIFCRNVMIYFDRPTRQKIIRKFYEHLVPAGLLFIGHSETLNDLDHSFVPVMPTVYRRLAVDRRSIGREQRGSQDD